MSAPSYMESFVAARARPIDASIEALTVGQKPACSHCEQGKLSLSRSALSAPLTSGEMEAGLRGSVVMLPERGVLAGDSVAHSQPQLNDGAFKHPILIVHEFCEHQVLCLPITSLGGKSLTEKYARETTSQNTRDNVYWSYLRFQHRDGEPRGPANDLATLDLTGKSLAKRSYLHLDAAFTIEYWNLEHMHDGQRRLTAASLDLASWAFQVVEKHRRDFGQPRSLSQQGRSPTRTPSPPSPARPSSGNWRTAGNWRAAGDWRAAGPQATPASRSEGFNAFMQQQVTTIPATTSWRSRTNTGSRTQGPVVQGQQVPYSVRAAHFDNSAAQQRGPCGAPAYQRYLNPA